MTACSRPAVAISAVFAGLLAAVPIRNPDLWRHLAAGRDLLGGGGRPTATWLFDLSLYLTEWAAGDWGLGAVKAAAVGLTGLLLARATGGGRLGAVATALAVLACGPRLLSFNTWPLLFLAVMLERLRADAPRWQLAVIALVWANTDRWVWVGVGVAALTLLGRAVDAARRGEPTGLHRAAGTTVLLVVVAMLNPAVWATPAELFDLGGRTELSLRSPFGTAYREALAASPAGLAYHPLLLLSAGSFLLTGWRWERALPWAAMAAVSGAQARFVPAFALVAGPVLAWNLADRVRSTAEPRSIARLAAGLAAVGLLVAAWSGWLVGPPYERRRLTVDLPLAVEQSAAAVAALGPSGRTLHLAPVTQSGFAWFLPAERGELADPDGEAVARFLAGDGADRAVILLTGPARPTPAVARLLAADRRTLVYCSGGAAVFVPAPAERPADLGRLAFGPAPVVGPPAPTHWTDSFTRAMTVWPPDRGEAAIAAALGDAAAGQALPRAAGEWDVVQAAGLVGAAGLADLALRLTLVAPPSPVDGKPPAVTAEVFGLIRRFAGTRDDVPADLAYLAVRAARRAVAADPADAAAHHLLGEAYLRVLGGTRERVWAEEVRPLTDFRWAQAATALERAVKINPRRLDSHLLLARLYRDIGCLDLAADHLRAAGGRADDLTNAVAARRAKVAAKSGLIRVIDRAEAAAQAGLGGEALSLLLGSDVAAFGATGVRLELELLNRTGRPHEVLGWTTPEVRESLGPDAFHRLRAVAAAAAGDYPTADAELAQIAGPAVPPEVWARAVGARLLSVGAGSAHLPDLVWRAVGESDFVTTAVMLDQATRKRAEVLAVRGLLALESGDSAAAERLFVEAETTRAESAGGRVGRAGLEWIRGR